MRKAPLILYNKCVATAYPRGYDGAWGGGMMPRDQERQGKKCARCRHAIQSDAAFDEPLWFHRACLEEGQRALQRAHALAARFGGVPADGSYLRGAVRPSRRAAEGQITNPLHDQVFRELEQPPKSVRVEDMETNASTSLPRAELVPSSQLRQRNAFWVSRAEEVRQESSRLCQQACELQARYQYWRQRYFLIACAWCEKPIRWQYMEEPLAVPATSHGICPACFETEVRALSLREP